MKLSSLLLPVNLPCLLLAIAPAAHAQVLSGSVHAIDGDTLDMAGTRIRLFGIDAPEAAQTCKRGGADWNCGAESSGQLRELVAGKQIRCETRDTDVYGRTVATCRAGNQDIAGLLALNGMAVVLPNGADAYGEMENRARLYRLGLWSGVFDQPAAWRAAHPRESQVARARPAAAARRAAPVQQTYTNRFGCAIKGNRSDRGEWIYHLPGMKYYEQTRPEELFCTEAAAVAGGYRRSRSG